MWVEVARVVRGQVISVKEMQYVTAARALGFGIESFLIISHLISWRQLLLFAAICISYISGKRFKLSGLGAQPHQWGSIIKDHYSYIIPVNRIWLWFLVHYYVA
jgi:peptide/nickel transport system permease protein